MPRLFLATSLQKTVERVPGLQKVLWALEALIIGIPMGISALLPADLASAAGRRVLRAIGPRLDKTRKFRRNLSLAFPEKSPAEIEALLQDVWGNAGAVLAEYPHLPEIARGTPPKRLEMIIDDRCRVFHEEGKPAVFVAAHLSNWELPALAVVQQGLPLSVAYTPIQNPWLDRRLYRAREKMGCELVGRDGGIRTLIRQLAHGKSIGLLVDQRIDSGEPVPFFGLPMNTSLAPARLALRFDCELIPIRVQRLAGARFRITFHAPIPPPVDAPDDHQKVLGMTRKINELFEQWITEQPDEWLCSNRRWPKDATRP